MSPHDDPRNHHCADRVTENLGAADVVLTHGDLRKIETAASKIAVQGAWLLDAVLAYSDAEAPEPP